MRSSFFLFYFLLSISISQIRCLDCINGRQISSTKSECICYVGWHGRTCSQCDGTSIINGDEGVIQNSVPLTPHNSNEYCGWVINTTKPGYYVNFKIHSFSLECIYDKLSFFTNSFLNEPELILSGHYEAGQVFSVKTNQVGQILAAFTTDESNSFIGFNLSYQVSLCPDNCSQHGSCVNGECICSSGYQGAACQYHILCRGFSCVSTGFDNSSVIGLWQLVSSDRVRFPSRALHASIQIGDYIYVYGGLVEKREDSAVIYRFSLLQYDWITLTPNQTDTPGCRYGHTLVYWSTDSSSHRAVMYGGVNCVSLSAESDVWLLTLSNQEGSNPHILWSRLTSANTEENALAAHISHIHRDVLISLHGFTHPPAWSPYIRRFNLTSRLWLTNIDLPNFVPRQTAYSRSVYIGGKIFQFSGISPSTVTDFIQYDLDSGKFSLLSPLSEANISGHYMVTHKGFIYRIGGCDLLKSTSINATECLTSSVKIYDSVCGRGWQSLTARRNGFFTTDKMDDTVHRMGHTAHVWTDSVTNRSAIVLIGGMRRSFQSEVFYLWLVSCEELTSQYCNESWKWGNRCYWNGIKCLSVTDFNSTHCFLDQKSRVQHVDQECNRIGISSSTHCLHAGNSQGQCVWCNHSDNRARCRSTELCQQLALDQSQLNLVIVTRSKRPCSQYKTCSNCSEDHYGSCTWMVTSNRCVDNTLSTALNPLGRELTHVNEFYACSNVQCTKINNCRHCSALPHCGWCEFAAAPGSGKCLFATPTSILSHVDHSTGHWVSDNSLCSDANIWAYDRRHCPRCACNGHANCTIVDTDFTKNANQVIVPEFIEDFLNVSQPSKALSCNSCRANTQGKYCSVCGMGYYGSTMNGATCKRCDCLGLAYDCNKREGHCTGYCLVAGTMGRNCTECSGISYIQLNHSCYYKAKIESHHIIEKSVHDFDRYNRYFMATTLYDFSKPTLLTINCINFKFGANLTYKLIQKNHIEVRTSSCTEFEDNIAASDSVNETEFYINITALFYQENNFKIEIKLVESSFFRFGYIFSAFTGSFVIFTSIGVIIMKMRQRYIISLNRRNLMQHQEQMAQRPFPQLQFDLYNDTVPLLSCDARNLRIPPSAVAGIQPLVTSPRSPVDGESSPPANFNKSEMAVVSVFIHLPGQTLLNNNNQTSEDDKVINARAEKILVLGSCLGVLGVKGRKEFEDSSRKVAANRMLEISDMGLSDTTLQGAAPPPPPPPPQPEVLRHYHSGLPSWRQFGNLFHMRRMRRWWRRNRDMTHQVQTPAASQIESAANTSLEYDSNSRQNAPSLTDSGDVAATV